MQNFGEYLHFPFNFGPSFSLNLGATPPFIGKLHFSNRIAGDCKQRATSHCCHPLCWLIVIIVIPLWLVWHCDVYCRIVLAIMNVPGALQMSPHSTVVQYITLHYTTWHCSTVLCSTVQYSAVQYYILMNVPGVLQMSPHSLAQAVALLSLITEPSISWDISTLVTAGTIAHFQLL